MSDHDDQVTHNEPAPPDVDLPDGAPLPPPDVIDDAHLTSGDSDRRSGQLMVAAGVLGLIVAVVGGAVGWRLVGDLRDATGESVDLTLETLDSVDDTVDLSEELIAAVGDTVAASEATLRAVDESFGAGSEVIGEVADLTDTVGPSLADVADVLRDLEDVADTIDDLLGDLSSIPLAPDYDPDQTMSDTVGRLAETVEELPELFESTSSDLADFDASVVDISGRIDELTTAVADVRVGLEESETLVGAYRRNVDDARTIAVGARDDLDADVALMRVVIVIGAIAVALGQIVPFWLGRRLLARSRASGTTAVD